MGLIEEEFALEYLIKLVKNVIDTKKYYDIRYKKDRLSYLRALSIGTLINEAAKVFLANETAILNGAFEHSLLDKCAYEAQINDILKISAEKVYRSKEVIEKEIVGYSIIARLLDVFLTSLNHAYEHTTTNYDTLVLQLLPEDIREPQAHLYDRIMTICSYVASLSDGAALQLFNKLNGKL
jgi:dGTPase